MEIILWRHRSGMQFALNISCFKHKLVRIFTWSSVRLPSRSPHGNVQMVSFKAHVVVWGYNVFRADCNIKLVSPLIDL